MDFTLIFGEIYITCGSLVQRCLLIPPRSFSIGLTKPTRKGARLLQISVHRICGSKPFYSLMLACCIWWHGTFVHNHRISQQGFSI
jgi:hypothetical protein